MHKPPTRRNQAKPAPETKVKSSCIHRTLTLALLLVASSAVFIFGIETAQANGGTRPVVKNETVGPYKLQVGIFPGKPRVRRRRRGTAADRRHCLGYPGRPCRSHRRGPGAGRQCLPEPSIL